jgi:ATP/ADP translocase
VGLRRPFRSLVVRAQDVLVVTAPGSGAEIIPFLKTWVNLPMAIGFTVMYAKVRTCGGGCGPRSSRRERRR